MGNMMKTYLHKFNLILLTWVDRSLFIGLGEKNLCHRDWIIGRETLVVKTCFQCKCDKGISIDSALIWKERFWSVLEKAVHEVLVILFMCRKENVKRSHICWGICFQSFLELLLVQESEESRSSLYSARLFSHCSSTTSSSVNHTPVHLCFCLSSFHNSFPVIRLPRVRTESFHWENLM